MTEDEMYAELKRLGIGMSRMQDAKVAVEKLSRAADMRSSDARRLVCAAVHNLGTGQRA